MTTITDMRRLLEEKRFRNSHPTPYETELRRRLRLEHIPFATNLIIGCRIASTVVREAMAVIEISDGGYEDNRAYLEFSGFTVIVVHPDGIPDLDLSPLRAAYQDWRGRLSAACSRATSDRAISASHTPCLFG